ncbi:hypothetical protein MKX01_006763 [Papaver californicum]|nr:hypothetical protein MKX01_006763 [Papaver californicum]
MVKWVYNQSSPAGTDADFKKFEVKLCFAPISQKQRAWSKTEEELLKDKTCQFLIVGKPYSADNKHTTNLFTFQAITGRHASISICAGVVATIFKVNNNQKLKFIL